MKNKLGVAVLCKSQFNEGDKEGIRIKENSRKGSESRYSDKIYNVESVNGIRITLNNDKKYFSTL